MSNDTLQIPMKLKGDESCENIGVKIFIDGILQEFSADNSEDYSYNNTLSVKTDDTPYELKIKAKFDGDIDTHTISAVSIYNPDYIPQSGVLLGVNHKCAAGGFRILPIADAQFEFSDSNAILKAPAPEPITDVIVEHP